MQIDANLILGMTLNGLVLTALYILVALGFALLLNIVNILNFAHGAIYMSSAYLCYLLAIGFGLNQWVSLLLSMVIMAAFGLFLERFSFRPFYGDFFRTVIMSIAIILILLTSINVTLGKQVLSLHPFFPGMLNLGPFPLSAGKLGSLVISFLLLAAVVWFIGRTKYGQYMQAIAQDREGAILQGISITRVSAISFAMGCALAAIAGGLMGALFYLTPIIGDQMLLKSIQLVILGGIGSVGGIFYAGLVIGFIDAFLPVFTDGSVAQLISISIVIVILVLRPQGFSGREML